MRDSLLVVQFRRAKDKGRLQVCEVSVQTATGVLCKRTERRQDRPQPFRRQINPPGLRQAFPTSLIRIAFFHEDLQFTLVCPPRLRAEYEMADTIAQLFRRTIAHNRPDAILTKESGAYQPISAAELRRRVGKLHLALGGVRVGAGDRCALLSENRWEWAVADFAMMTAGVVSVPVYPTLTADQLVYLLEHSESRVLFVSNATQLDKAIKIWERLPKLEGVVVFDNLSAGDDRVITLKSLIGDTELTPQEAARFDQAIDQVRPEDLASIIYTSGTTGTPKGVMLSHGNFATNVRDCGFDISSKDICLSFLPLCHVAERTADYVYFAKGAGVAYAESMENVPKNMLEVRPTMTVAAPRFFEKVHGRVMTAMAEAPPMRRRMFDWAISVGREVTELQLAGKPIPFALGLSHKLADALVLKKLRGRLGGRFERFVSGAAPLAKHLAEFFFAAGLPIYEAYGLTETSPLVSINTAQATRLGTVGKVIQNVEVRIADDGEILVRGPNVMQGYFKDPETTAETIQDGWLLTGDIGEISPDGFLKITDRKKDLFKTSGGKFIAPQPIENQLKSSPFVSMAVVFAEGRKFPSVLIVPNFDRLVAWAQQRDIPTHSMKELVEDSRVREFMDAEIESACGDMARYERPKKAIYLDRELTIENGEITPTMKVRRRAVEMKFQRRIDALYED